MRTLLGRLILTILTAFLVLAGVMPERGEAATSCVSLVPNSVLIGDASNATCTVDAAAPLNGFRISNRLDRGSPAVFAYHNLNGQLISDPLTCSGVGCLGSGSANAEGCDPTKGCALSFSYQDQNGALVTVTMTVPATSSFSPLISGASATGGAFTLAPVVISVSPATAPTVGGGYVTITGSNFTGATRITFGGATAPIYTINSATQIAAWNPNHAVGVVDIAVTTPSGTGTGTGLFTYVKTAQTVGFTSAVPANAIVGGAAYTPVATATSRLPVTIGIDASSASICSMTGGAISYLGAGTCLINANQAGDATYLAAPQAQQSIVVNKASQTITFPAISSRTYGAAPFGVTATASSGLPVTLTTATPGACSVSGNTVTIVAAGMCSIDATQAGSSNYEAALTVRQSFSIGKATPTASITSSANPSVTGQPVTFTMSVTGAGSPPTGTLIVLIDDLYLQDMVLSGGTAAYTTSALSAEGHAILFTYAGDGNYQSSYFQLNHDVGKGATTTAFTASPNPSNYSQTVTLTAIVAPVAPATGAPVGAVTFKNGTTFLGQADITRGIATLEVATLGAGTHALTAAYSGNSSFLTSTSATVSQVVGLASQTIVFVPPNGRTFIPGVTLALTATGGASALPIVFATSTPSVCSVTGNSATILAAGACTISADQAGNSNFAAAATVRATVEIGKADQNPFLAYASPASIAFSGTSTLATVGGSGTGAVSYAVTAGASFCALSGTTLTGTGVGTCTVTATKAADANYNAATEIFDITVGKAAQTALIASASPASIAFNGTSTLATTSGSGTGAVSYAVTAGASVCTISGTTLTGTGVGSCTVTATKAADATYNAATAVVDITVGKAAQTITFSKPTDQTFVANGQLPLSASATSGLEVSFVSTTGSVCGVAGSMAVLIAPGTCSISARQPGNANFSAAASVTQSFSIEQFPTTTTLTSSAESVLMNQPFQLMATVSVPNQAVAKSSALRATASAVPTGTVTFKSGTSTLCSNVTLSGGVATCKASISKPGTQAFVAVFSGAGAYGNSASSALARTVLDQQAKTASAVGRFMGRRNDLIASSEPDAGRQIDRLMEAGGDNSSTPGAGLAEGRESDRVGHDAVTSSRLGSGPDGSDLTRMRLGAGRTDRALQDSPMAGAADDNPLPANALAARSHDEQNSGGGGMAIGGLRLNSSGDGATRLGFSTSLRDVARFAAQAEAEKSGDPTLGLAGRTGNGKTARPNPFDIWAEGKYTSFRDSRATSDIDGHFGVISVGADYVVRPSLLIGTMVQFDSLRQRSDKDRSEVRGQGWMAGPYATLRLSQNVFWQMRAAWGRSNNEVSPYLTHTDSFGSERWLASTTVTGRWGIGPWTVKPAISVTYLEDVARSFTETYGTIVPEVKSRLGQAKAGPEVAYRLQLNDGIVLEPRAGVQVIWNFAGDTTVAGQGQLNGENAGPQGVRGRAELGLRATSAGGVGLDLSSAYDGIGTNGYSNVTARATVRLKLN
jgi:outer membrane autotransporter protein